MKELFVALLALIAFVVIYIVLIYDDVRQFGWSVLLVRFAGYINGAFITLMIIFHRLPWNAFRYDATPVVSVANSFAIYAAFLVFCYLLSARRPTRWLMKPTLKRLLYSTTMLAFVGMYAALKGWL